MTDTKVAAARSTAKAAAATKAPETPAPEIASQPAPVQGADAPATASGQTQVVKLTQPQAMELQTRQWSINFELFKLIYRHEMTPAQVAEAMKMARASVFSPVSASA